MKKKTSISIDEEVLEAINRDSKKVDRSMSWMIERELERKWGRAKPKSNGKLVAAK